MTDAHAIDGGPPTARPGGPTTLAEGPADSGRRRYPRSDPRIAGRREVLLCDDHAMIRNGLRHIIDDTRDLVVTGEAPNGGAVMQMLREDPYHLVILDMSMPGRSGLELLKLIKADHPHLPVLIYTMHQEEQYAVRAIRGGAGGYLTKEHDGETLLAAARRVAGGGLFITPRVAELLAMDTSRSDTPLPHTLLSDREFQVFDRIVRGMSLTAIADDLSLSIKTISTHKSHILEKLALGNQVELVRYAIDHDLA